MSIYSKRSPARSVAIALTIGGLALTIASVSVQTTSAVGHHAAVSDHATLVSQLRASLEPAASKLAAVNAQITAAEGKVLNPDVLSAARAQAKESAVVEAAAAVAASSGGDPRQTLTALGVVDAKLDKTINDLSSAVTAWAVEQTRLASVKQAAAAAEAAARAQAAVVRPSTTSRAPAPAVAPSPSVVSGYVQRVWTSGFQDQINACRGAVDVTAVYHVRVIAEHSKCGGARFPTASGALVTVTGLDAGQYRVIGVVARLNGQVNHAEDIPRGYDLLYQTCANGFTDMTFTALQKIG